MEIFYDILTVLFSTDTRQSMIRKVTSERSVDMLSFPFRSLSRFSYSDQCRMKKVFAVRYIRFPLFHAFVTFLSANTVSPIMIVKFFIVLIVRVSQVISVCFFRSTEDLSALR